MNDLLIAGGTVLFGSDGLVKMDLSLRNGLIERAGTGTRIDATGLLVLPGIVDLHGDAFERQRYHHGIPWCYPVLGAWSAKPDRVAGVAVRSGCWRVDV
jgi:alpha-D-ribose 1-methylphosphonate 5-triphosphate diphosphatase PhnM